MQPKVWNIFVFPLFWWAFFSEQIYFFLILDVFEYLFPKNSLKISLIDKAASRKRKKRVALRSSCGDCNATAAVAAWRHFVNKISWKRGFVAGGDLTKLDDNVLRPGGDDVLRKQVDDSGGRRQSGFRSDPSLFLNLAINTTTNSLRKFPANSMVSGQIQAFF